MSPVLVQHCRPVEKAKKSEHRRTFEVRPDYPVTRETRLTHPGIVSSARVVVG